MSANGAASYVIVVLALLWLAVAIGLSMLAARRLRLAQGLLAAARSAPTSGSKSTRSSAANSASADSLHALPSSARMKAASCRTISMP